MRRDDLVEAVKRTLHRLPSEFASHYGVLPEAPTENTVPAGEATASLRRAHHAIGEVSAMAAELHDRFVLSRILCRKEAVSSSAIEGTNSTLDELLSAEEGGDEDIRSETRQVRDYALTLETLVPHAQGLGNEIFSVDLIRRLHERVIGADPNYQDPPGALRERVVWIGGTGHIASSIFNPPAPEFVARCLDEHVAYLHCDGMQKMTQDIITRMAVGHAHFEAIHPFRDGNGRVGRLLLPLMMAADGQVPLCLSPYIEANNESYYTALKAAQQRLDYSALIGFMADAAIGTVAEIKNTRAELTRLKTAWASRRKFRSGSTALAALDVLQAYPVLTIDRLATLLSVSFQAASVAIRQLEMVGILTERTGYRRNRLFVADEVLAILRRPFGAGR